MAVKHLDIKQVVCTFGPIILRGYAEGSAISIAFDEDLFDVVVGCDGETTRSRKNNNNATVEITLAQSSGAHEEMQLSTLRTSALSSQTFPMFINDIMNGELYSSAEAFVKKLPDAEMNNGVTERKWTICCPDMIQSSAEFIIGVLP